MERSTTILRSALGALMILAGIQHFRDPAMYAPFIPDALPKNLITYLSGALEILLGAGVFVPRYRSMATLGILILMIVFLPLHVVDVFRAEPAIGSTLLAYVRLPLQFVLIAWAWYVNRQIVKSSATEGPMHRPRDGQDVRTHRS